MKRKCVLLSCLILIGSICACTERSQVQIDSMEQQSTQKEQKEATKNIEIDYMNRLGQKIFCSAIELNEDAVIYEKLPSELNREIEENIALAESTYRHSNVYILTEGHINSIEKVESGEQLYYIELVERGLVWESGKVEFVTILFPDETTQKELLGLKKGEYVTLLCQFSKEQSEIDTLLEVRKVLEPEDDSKNSMTKFMGMTVEDIIRLYGSEFLTDWYGGDYFYYEEGCPYVFYYLPTDSREGKISDGDVIIGVGTGVERTPVLLGIKVGDSLEQVEKQLGMKLHLVYETESENSCLVDGCAIADTDVEIHWRFDPDSLKLISASSKEAG